MKTLILGVVVNFSLGAWMLSGHHADALCWVMLLLGNLFVGRGMYTTRSEAMSGWRMLGEKWRDSLQRRRLSRKS